MSLEAGLPHRRNASNSSAVALAHAFFLFKYKHGVLVQCQWPAVSTFRARPSRKSKLNNRSKWPTTTWLLHRRLQRNPPPPLPHLLRKLRKPIVRFCSARMPGKSCCRDAQTWGKRKDERPSTFVGIWRCRCGDRSRTEHDLGLLGGGSQSDIVDVAILGYYRAGLCDWCGECGRDGDRVFG